MSNRLGGFDTAPRPFAIVIVESDYSMIDADATDRRKQEIPLTAESGVMFATREMFVDGLAILRETVRRKPILLVVAFALSALAGRALFPTGRRR